MEFLLLLYQLIFMPLQIIFEVIYNLAFRVIGNPGVSIIALSLIVNLLVLPIYNRADTIQEAERDIEAKLSKGVEHIKKTFKGDEQLMMLQTYYRQNGYSPLDSIKGSLSLFLEIPFFVAAYQFLSHLEILNGASLGPIKDLGAPDGLWSIAGMTINVLPFVMTAVNLVSAYIFTKDLTSKTKVQLYSMACFFLVFLYASPAGLVFYWTLNNLFNLVKTVICKLDDTEKGVNIAMGLCGIFIVVYSSLLSPNPNIRKTFYSAIFALLLNARFIYSIIKSKFPVKNEVVPEEPKRNIFYAGALFLAVLIGALIPSAVIESSPKEFVILNYFDNPLWYVANAFFISLGTFVLWAGVFYWLTQYQFKANVERILWIASGTAIVNYMFFNYSFGVLNTILHYENRVNFSKNQRIINLLTLVILVIVLDFIWRKYKKYIFEILVIGIVALGGMSIFNIVEIYSVVANKDSVITNKVNKDNFTFSKTGKNVVVIMLDRALGGYVPFIFNEKPELKDKFSGFTYYSNIISHGGHTIFGAPGIFGGYEYTPMEINKRNKETLVKKHNEANALLPNLFSEVGFKINSGLSYVEDSIVTDKDSACEIVDLNNRNFYFYGLFKTAPILLQKYLYDNGDYLSGRVFNQEIKSLHTSFGINKDFMREYKVLDSLPSMSLVNDSGNNFITFISNVTHLPCLLQMPEYVPSSTVNNTEFSMNAIMSANYRKLNISTVEQMSHYHVNMASLIKLAEWFDFMRENEIYDNTRIILVSDHGYQLNQFEELVLDRGKNVTENIEWYYPLLLVKDFNSKEFSVSEEFMTNADVATLAIKGIISNPKNPFTGNLISDKAKFDSVQYVFASRVHSLNKHSENTYNPSDWYSVHTNMLDKKNWKLEKEEAVLPY